MPTLEKVYYENKIKPEVFKIQQLQYMYVNLLSDKAWLYKRFLLCHIAMYGMVCLIPCLVLYMLSIVCLISYIVLYLSRIVCPISYLVLY